MIDLGSRARKVNIELLTDEQLVDITTQLVEKINKIVEKANQDANKILNIYGLETTVQMLTPTPIGINTEPKE